MQVSTDQTDRSKYFALGPRTGLDQDRHIMVHLGPDRIDGSRTDSSQKPQTGPDRKRTTQNYKARTNLKQSIPGAGGPWIPISVGNT